MSSTRVLFYALGGGWGHITRCLNVLRSLSGQLDIEPLILCPTRCLAKVVGEFQAKGTEKRDPRALGQWVLSCFESFQPELLLVDTFPRGILAELPKDLNLSKVLISRWTRPDFCLQKSVLESLESYDEVLWVEDKPHLELPGIEVGIVTDPRPLLSRSVARAQLSASDKPLVTVLGSGPLEQQKQLELEVATLGRSENWDTRFLSHELQSAYPNLGRFFKGVDLIVAAAGYNSYYEISRAGVPALFIPQARKFDDQLLRVTRGLQSKKNQHHQLYHGAESVSQQLSDLLGCGHQSEQKFQGGEQIAEWLSTKLSSSIAPGKVTH